MENLKVKVNNEAESLEVQQLLEEFFGLESVMFSGSIGWVAWNSKCFSTYPKSTPSLADRCKEITIQELRDMAVAQQKQYEPFFTPECTLNDQYAEIEQVRQELKGVDATLAQRQAEYGCFEDVAFVTENIMATLAKVRPNGLHDLPHTHRMALYMIASKMARIVNGDFNKLDSWHDIGGYAKLIENLIEGK